MLRIRPVGRWRYHLLKLEPRLIFLLDSLRVIGTIIHHISSGCRPMRLEVEHEILLLWATLCIKIQQCLFIHFVVHYRLPLLYYDIDVFKYLTFPMFFVPRGAPREVDFLAIVIL